MLPAAAALLGTGTGTEGAEVGMALAPPRLTILLLLLLLTIGAGLKVEDDDEAAAFAVVADVALMGVEKEEGAAAEADEDMLGSNGAAALEPAPTAEPAFIDIRVSSGTAGLPKWVAKKALRPSKQRTQVRCGSAKPGKWQREWQAALAHTQPPQDLQ